MRGNAHVRFGGRAGETHITRVAQGAPVRPYYVKAGLEKQKAALLVVIGAMSDGRKEVLAIVPGYRESKASWTGVLCDLRDRGLSAATADTDPVRADPSRSDKTSRSIRQTIPHRMPRRRRYPRARLGPYGDILRLSQSTLATPAHHQRR